MKKDNKLASFNHFKKQLNTEDIQTISEKIAEDYTKIKEGM